MSDINERTKGRKLVLIDLQELEKLSALHGAGEEIARWFVRVHPNKEAGVRPADVRV